MVALWRRPALADPDPRRRERAVNVTIAVSLLFALLLAALGVQPDEIFWLVLVVAALPAAASVVDRSVDHILTPPGTLANRARPACSPPRWSAARAALLIIGAIWLLAWGWGIHLETLTASDTMAIRLLRAS